jgi:hypothetical protein
LHDDPADPDRLVFFSEDLTSLNALGLIAGEGVGVMMYSNFDYILKMLSLGFA